MELKSKIKAVKPKVSFGNLRLTSKTSPEVKNLKLGQKMTVEVEIEVEALRQPDRWEISENGVGPKDILANVNIGKIIFPKAKK